MGHIESCGLDGRSWLERDLQFEAVDQHARGEIGNLHSPDVVEKPLPFPVRFWGNHNLKLAFADSLSRGEGFDAVLERRWLRVH